MSNVDVAQWLEQWVETNLTHHAHVSLKAEMHDQAKACVEEAVAVGISVVEVKDAADGDLETYLMERKNVLAIKGGITTAPSMRSSEVDASLGLVGDEVIPIIEERLDVGKREVSHGKLSVHSHVVETAVTERVTLRTESVQVDRRPVDRAVEALQDPFRDRTIELEEFAEEAIVSKDVRVIEEISLRKEIHDRTETVHDTLRHTEVEIDDGRTGNGAVGARGVREGSDDGRIVEHMEVYASDGTKVGTVEHMDGPDRFKLAKSTSPDGQHHFVPMAWVDHVDRHVHLNKTVSEMKSGL